MNNNNNYNEILTKIQKLYKNSFENLICNMSAILFRSQCDNSLCLLWAIYHWVIADGLLDFWQVSCSCSKEANWITIVSVNSLAIGTSGNDFKSVIHEHMLLMKFMSTSYEIVRRWKPQNTFVAKSTLVQVMAWCSQLLLMWSFWNKLQWNMTLNTKSCIKMHLKMLSAK